MIEPLDPIAWSQSMDMLRLSLNANEETKDAVRLRKAYHLLQLAPAPIKQWVTPAIPEDLFEDLLAHSADLAAISLIGSGMSYKVQNTGADTNVSVQITITEAQIATTIESATLAKAIVQALCQAVNHLLDVPRVQTN